MSYELQVTSGLLALVACSFSLVAEYFVKKESSTKSFVLRIDADTMSAIEAWAADEFRSTNGQLQWIIAEALRKSGRLKKQKNIKKENNHETE